MQEHAPLLHGFLQAELVANLWKLPARACKLLRLVLDKARAGLRPAPPPPSRKRSRRAETAAAALATEEAGARKTPEAEFLESGFYYPTLPIKRHVRR